MRRYGFLLALAIPALMLVTLVLTDSLHSSGLNIWANAAMWLPLAVLYGLLPLADLALGRDRRNSEVAGPAWCYRALPAGCAVMQFVLLYLYLDFARNADWISMVGWVGLVLSMGVVSGINAINVAHELIHRKNPWLANLGGLLLCSVAYAGFKIEHVRGHHVWVSTPNDPASAATGQSVFAFLPRSISNNALNAWHLEARRLRLLHLPLWHWRNEMLWWQAVTLCLMLLIWTWAGAAGLAAWIGQALIAIVSLEVINYVEHYGLRRQQLANGRYQRPGPQDSWNSDFWLSNQMLLHLQRHSDHHARPRVDYQNLQSVTQAPQLPAGYASMFLLALVPPLWFRVMHPRLPTAAGQPADKH